MKRLLLVLAVVTIIFSAAPEGADLLILCPESFYTAFQPLAEWKTNKGIYTEILFTDGMTSTEIRNMIQGRIDDWAYDPRYILIGADVDLIPMLNAGSTIYGGFRSDWSYANFDSDIPMEYLIGRLPAENSYEAEIMVNKVLRYEKGTEVGDWLETGILIENEDYDDDDDLYQANLDTARAGMTRCGYTTIHEFHDDEGDEAVDVQDAVAAGAGFVLYRGQGTHNWYMPFAVDPLAIENINRTPIVASITCNTVTDYGSNYVDYHWMVAGTPESGKGAVAFYGSTSSISGGADIRGAVSDGFVMSFFSDTTNDLGVAAEAGRLRVWTTFRDTAQYTSHVLLGDPEMDIRTKAPEVLDLYHTGILVTDSLNEYTCTVIDRETSEPVEKALICLSIEDGLYERGITDADGNLFITVNPTTTGTAKIVVTAHNYYPYTTDVDIISEGPNIVITGFRIEDEDDNEQVNPGESCEMFLTVKNNGLSGTSLVSTEIFYDGSCADITSPSTVIERLNPGEEVEIPTPIDVFLSPGCTHLGTIPLTTNFTDSTGKVWNRLGPILPVARADLRFISAFLGDTDGDTDGILDPSEGSRLIVRLINSGDLALDNAMLRLESMTCGLVVEDDRSFFPVVPVEEELRNLHDPFYVSYMPLSPVSARGELRLIITADANFYDLVDTVFFQIDLDGSEVTGPDGYGYFCYDNTDLSTGRAPTFRWRDISSTGENITSVSNSDDRIETLDLPFNFQYYGEVHDQVSICANGFITIGHETWTGGSGYGHEQVIPHVGEAHGMIAAFWDDLNPRESGDVYWLYDPAEHSYIIQYDRIGHYGYPSVQENFEIILYDPAFITTVTGDGVIDILYHELTYPSSNTVGIENYDETDGIQYVYWASYARNAASLQYGRAIRFTTNPPVMSSAWPAVFYTTLDDSTYGNGNGQADGGETVILDFWIKNTGNLLVDGLFVEPSTEYGYAHVLSGSFEVGGIAPGDSAGPFTCTVELGPSSINRTIDVHLAMAAAGFSRYSMISFMLYASEGISEETVSPGNLDILFFPNPFNSSVEINAPQARTIEILGTDGRLILRTSGNHLFWSPDESIPSGVYLVRAAGHNAENTGKIILIR